MLTWFIAVIVLAESFDYHII
jgi:hypothetical protein